MAQGTVAGDLAPLLPELAREASAEQSRDRLFGAVVEVVRASAGEAPPVLIVLDDAQWCDEASAALLHYVARMTSDLPVVVALAVREGELPDNEPLMRLFRSLRHELSVDEIRLGSLSREETEQLVQTLAPDIDAERIYRESAGNPLFALEAARSLPYRQGDVSPSLTDLVRDRIERLSREAGDVLRWCALLGHTFSITRLTVLTPIDLDSLMTAFEALERHAHLHEVLKEGKATGSYAFSHDVVRKVVNADISEPRRRLMHLRIAKALDNLSHPDETVAADIAHHAALAGEAGMAAGACVTAGRRCLRLFANTEAVALARRGIHYAEQLGEPERLELTLELMQVQLAAQRSEAPDETAERIEELAERALDYGCLEHARLGFQILSRLRWEGGEWKDAQSSTMRAEFVSRSGDQRQRAIATAEAARGLAMLERDLDQVEALLLEAEALSKRLGIETIAVPAARGMLHHHRGALDEATACFVEARTLARREGDRSDEFQALEHLIRIEIERHDYAAAESLCTELMVIANKLREGSEVPFARALAALSSYGAGRAEAVAPLDEALAQLRLSDAKHRLAYTLNRAAQIELERGRAESAQARAAEAHRIADALVSASETVLATLLLARSAKEANDTELHKRYVDALATMPLDEISAHARRQAEHLLAEQQGTKVVEA
jgi:predicted ATPase